MHPVSTLLILVQLSTLPLRAWALSLPTSPQNPLAHSDFYYLKPRDGIYLKHPHRRPERRESAPSLPLNNTASDFSSHDVPSKLVFAHFLVGNTYPYQVSDWSRDIQLASSRGIDAFALNVGPDPWQWQRVSDAYAAAKSSNTGFKLFMSFDMTVLPCYSSKSADSLQKYIKTYAKHSNQQLYQNKVLASSFSGEHCTFGQNSLDRAWSFAMKSPQNPKVHFVPSFFVDPKTFPSMKEVDGQFNWNSGWPTGASDLTFDSDKEYIADLKGKTYMAAVSPWFFTHYSPQTYNKNFIYRSDDWLWVSRWEALITNRSLVDLIQVISWNDYGESHYIGPIEGAQPDSQAWVDGMDHQPWNDIMTYYIQAFKTGRYPAIVQDRIFMWSRLWPANSTASNDAVGKPKRWQYTEDAAWAIVFATSSANVTLTCHTSRVKVLVPAGVSKLKLPLVMPGQISASMTRGSDSAGGYHTVVSLTPAGFEYKLNPTTYNFNALVVASP